MLHPDDEKDGAHDIIHILSANEACEMNEFSSYKNLTEIIKEREIKDWSGLCTVDINRGDIVFGMDRNDYLYIATSERLHAVTLNDLQGGDLNCTV